MRRIKKSLMLTGVFVIIFLMISTVTVVPKAQGFNINITHNKNRQILKQRTKENNQYTTDILLKIESLKNSKEVKDQVKNIDTLIKQKLGGNYLEEFATTSSLEKDIDIDVLIGSIASALICVSSKVYKLGIPIALCITISANIVYNLLLAKAIFLSNTPIVAMFATIALFIITTVYSVFIAFTWPFWLAFIIYEKIVSDEPILNQYNTLLTNIV